MKRRILGLALIPILMSSLAPGGTAPLAAQDNAAAPLVPLSAYQGLRWRNVGAGRGGRVTALAGVRQQPHTFYIGASGGGVWKTDDAGSPGSRSAQKCKKIEIVISPD